MLNIYGEKVNLTAAQKKAYVALLNGAMIVERNNRKYQTFQALVNKGLVKISYAWSNASKFERWM